MSDPAPGAATPPHSDLRERIASAIDNTDLLATYPEDRAVIVSAVMAVVQTTLSVLHVAIADRNQQISSYSRRYLEATQSFAEAERAEREQWQRAQHLRETLDERDSEIARLRDEIEQWRKNWCEHDALLTASIATAQRERDDARRQRDEAAEIIARRDAAIARVRRLCDLTIFTSCRVQAIDQAQDTLRALDHPEDP